MPDRRVAVLEVAMLMLPSYCATHQNSIQPMIDHPFHPPAVAPGLRRAPVPLAALPMQLEDGLVLLRADVNGKTLTLILDTGSGMTVLDSAVAKTLGLRPVTGKARAVGAGPGTPGVALAIADAIRLGGVALPNQRLAIVDLSAVSAALGRQVDGTLGYDVFATYTVRVDYPGRQVQFYAPLTYESVGEVQVIPVDISRHVPVAAVSIMTPRGDSLSAQLVFDMGTSGVALQLSPTFVKRHDLINRVGPTVNLPVGVGVGGEGLGYFARMKAATVSSLTIQEPIAGLWADQSPLPLDGTLGASVFDNWPIVIDYARHRVIAEFAETTIPPRRFFDASGLVLSRASRDGSGTRVTFVLPGSPAGEAGINVGDELTAIDGRTVAEESLTLVRTRLAESGQMRRLEMRRGSSVRLVTIQLRNLL